MPATAPLGRHRVAGAAAVALAGVGQAVVAFYTVAAIGLFGLPLWAALLLTIAWAAGVVGIVALRRRGPLVAPVVPIAGALVLWGVLAIGGAWLRWTP